MRSFVKLSAASIAAMSIISVGAANSQTLYAADNLSSGTLSGVVELDSASLSRSASFLTTGTVTGLATNGASVFASLPDGVSRYDAAGVFEGSYPNIGNDQFADLTVSGNTLYAADNLTSGDLSGVVAIDIASLNRNYSFLTSGTITGLTTNGTDIFASLPDGISEYTLTGNLIGSYQNLGNDDFGALAYANGTLYAADNLTDGTLSGVVLIDGTLSRIDSFLTTGQISGLATDGVSVYASLPDGITKYTTSGTIVGSYPNVGNDQFGALALAPAVSAAPEPGAWLLMLAGVGILGLSIRSQQVFAREAKSKSGLEVGLPN